LLVRSLFAMYVAVPVVVVLIARSLRLHSDVGIAMVVLAISSGAPLLPKKLMRLGRDSYVLSLVVTSSLLAVVAVPAWLEILALIFGVEASLEPAKVAIVIAGRFLAPLLLGMLIRWPLGRFADRLSDWIQNAAEAAIVLSGLTLLALQWRAPMSVGLVPLLALGGTALLALAIGHALGGPDPHERTALAVTCATRHVGVALLAASTVPGAKVTELVLVYLVVAVIATALYMNWRSRRVTPPPNG
jgi:BASS family bile acid:Na+ symporter